MLHPVLMPAPRQIQWHGHSVTLPANVTVVLSGAAQALLPTAQRFGRQVQSRLGIAVHITANAAPVPGGMQIVVDCASARVDHPQGYALRVTPAGMYIEAAAPAGAAYGLITLQQLLHDRLVEAVDILDFPDFDRRGFMLDISRGKVPTMETVYRLVDQLADLKLNELQLYTEHTFAYQKHQAVWQNYSPMTGAEILALDRYCQERYIDLVPNQNSFGHMTPWLTTEGYKHLAETQDGWIGWGIKFEDPFSLSPQEPAVLPFLEELYDELLPHFTSPYFNVGCDETLDVGQGRSKEAVAARGHRVYLDFLLEIHQRVKARGKTMQFWGDIIVEAPELIPELPKDVVAMEWGYEANHAFDTRCGHFAKAGIPFYVCPGTSTWNSLVGRTANALGNMLSAAENGLKHGAVGYLNTAWGDRGHQDYQPVSYLPIAYGAAVSWAVDANREPDLAGYLNVLLGDASGQIGHILYDLGNVYKFVGNEPGNGSVLAYLLHLGFQPERLGWILKGVTPETLDQAAARIRELAGQLAQVRLTHSLYGEDGVLVVQELHNSVRMLLHACELGKLRLASSAGQQPERAQVQTLLADLTAIIAEHRRLWLERNRLGGLEEMSLVPLRKLAEGYKALL